MKANQLSRLAQQYTSVMLKALGLCMVIYAVWSVTTSRFDILREQTGNLSPSYISAAQRTRELDCLTRNIYWEAASEPFEGKAAVAQIVLNRTDSGKFPADICGVIYQKNIVYEKVICQFSWFCSQVVVFRPIDKALYNESMEVAKKVLLEGFRLPSLKTALYYHGDYIANPWGKKPIAHIGRHIFYE
jgi:spore germination cell wall hydrolase CwlJ-like protein